MKRAGFSQGIYQISSTRKEKVGSLRILSDGRKFRYAKAGGADLAAGKMGVAAQIDSDVTNETAIAAAVGTKVLALTITSTTIAEDYFKGGYLQINDAAGEGYSYPIEASTAVVAGTAISITIEEGLKVALTTSSEFTLVHSPWMATVESATEENIPIGIPVMVVTTLYYYWAQTGGVAICLASGTEAVGTRMVLGATAGSVKAMSASVDVDIPEVGWQMGTAGIDGEYKPIFLTID
jgi:hypothetical protein